MFELSREELNQVIGSLEAANQVMGDQNTSSLGTSPLIPLSQSLGETQASGLEWLPELFFLSHFGCRCSVLWSLDHQRISFSCFLRRIMVAAGCEGGWRHKE